MADVGLQLLWEVTNIEGLDDPRISAVVTTVRLPIVCGVKNLLHKRTWDHQAPSTVETVQMPDQSVLDLELYASPGFFGEV
jgi:hypothetical protein